MDTIRYKQCNTCNTKNVWSAAKCEECGADIKYASISEEMLPNPSDLTPTPTHSRLIIYLKIVGLLFLSLSIISAIYFISDFSVIGISLGLSSLLTGAFVHSITLGIARLLETATAHN